jgi:hypothetical protein
MSKPTIDQIADMAERACFYVDPQGKWLRVDYCDMENGHFACNDESTGEEYAVDFDEITLEDRECFYQLTKMEVPNETK